MTLVRDGKLVVLLGVDGAGKSAVAEGMVAAMCARDGAGAAVAHWARWEPRLFRGARRALGRRLGHSKSDEGGKNETAGISRFKDRLFGPLLPLGLAYLASALADYVMQQRGHVRRLVRTHRVVVLDRYWYDLVVDAVGNSPRARSRAVRVVARVRRVVPLPQPDAVILLDVDPEIAHRRKGGENPIEFIRVRRDVYRDVTASLGGVVVDASAPLDIVLRDALQAAGTRVESH